MRVPYLLVGLAFLLLLLVIQYRYLLQTKSLLELQLQQIVEINATWTKTITSKTTILAEPQLKVSHKVTPSPSNSPTLKPTPSMTQKTQKIWQQQAILFTMDSIGSYEAESKRGGASGELLIRHCLEDAFAKLGIKLKVVQSDDEFASSDMNQFHIIIVDPWTWAGKGWNPKPMLIGNEEKIFVLDFFGSKNLLNSKSNFQIPSRRLLTAYGSPWNTFLGYYLNETILKKYDFSKKRQGVIWGKDPRHYSNREQLLATLSRQVQLHSTATRPVIKDSEIIWHGHQTVDSWMELLAKSKFLLGLGDPLLGPSAIDAISMGCVYINPIYSQPVKDIHSSQHSYAAKNIGLPYVCNVNLDNIQEVKKCIDYALQIDLKPFIPPDFQYDKYIERVKKIFLDRPA